MNYKDNLLSIFPLFNNVIENNTCEKGLLLYKNNSCYADSVLMILFFNPNKYIKNLLFREYRFSKNNVDKIYNHLTLDKNNEYRINIRKILVRIYQTIQNNKNNQDITRELLEIINKNRLKFVNPLRNMNNFSPGTQSDPIPFMELILSILRIEKVKFKKIIYGTNELSNINYKNIFEKHKKSKTIYLKTPFIDINLLASVNKNNLSDFFIDDTIFDEKNKYKIGEVKYSRKIEFKSISDTDILVFNIQRCYSVGGNVDGREIIPNEYLSIEDSEQKLTLTGIITRTDLEPICGHYTTRILCNNKWYFYNDMGGIFKIIGEGTYKEMLEYNQTKNFSVLCLYQKI